MDVKDLLSKAQSEFRHHKKVVLIGVGALIFLVIEIGAMFSIRASLSAAKAQLAARSQEVAMSKTTGLARLTPSELAKLERRMNVFKDGFVKAAEISFVLNRISDQAEKNGVRVLNINSEEPVVMKTDTEPVQNFTRFPIRVVLEGKYQAIAEFLHSLARSSRQIFVVESYKTAKTKEADALNCEMVLSFFWGS